MKTVPPLKVGDKVVCVDGTSGKGLVLTTGWYEIIDTANGVAGLHNEGEQQLVSLKDVPGNWWPATMFKVLEQVH